MSQSCLAEIAFSAVRIGAAAATAASVAFAASAAPVPERGTRVNMGGALEFALPVNSIVGRRFETVIRQQYDFSCGSAALATLLRYHYDDAQNEQSVFVGMFRDGDQAQIRKVGFSLLDMKRYLAARGIAADGYRVTLDQIAKAHTPSISGATSTSVSVPPSSTA